MSSLDLPAWLRPDHPLIRPVLHAQRRRLQAAEWSLLVALLGLGAWLAQLFPTFPRAFHLIVPLILLGLVIRVAVLLAAGQGMDADLARGALDQVRVTTLGTDAALLARASAAVYQLRDLIGVSVLARIGLAVAFVVEMYRWPSDALGFIFLEAQPELPWIVVTLLLSLGLLAAIGQPLADAALSAALGVWLAQARERGARALLLSLGVLLRLTPWAAVIGGLILLGRFEQPYLLYGPDDPLRGVLGFAAAAEGSFGLALATLQGSGLLVARIAWGLLIGPATLLAFLGELGLARMIVRLATYRLDALPEVRLRWRLTAPAVGAAILPLLLPMQFIQPLAGNLPCRATELNFLRRIFPPSEQPMVTPAWAPDGSRIAFRARGVNSEGDIFVIDADGGDERNLTGSAAYERLPEWSPDGTALVFQRRGADGWDGVYLELATGNEARLIQGVAHNWNPAWSPDGNRIAFQRRDANNPEIYVVQTDGSGLRNVSRRPQPDWSPVWSPDGRQLAFSTTEGNRRTLRIVDLSGQMEARTVEHAATDWNPVWSPDGRRVTFQSFASVGLFGLSVLSGAIDIDLFVLDAVSGELRNLAWHPATDRDPRWTEAGGLITFVRATPTSRRAAMVVDVFGLAAPRPVAACPDQTTE